MLLFSHSDDLPQETLTLTILKNLLTLYYQIVIEFYGKE